MIGCFALFVFLVSHDSCASVSNDVMGVTAVCDCGMPALIILTILVSILFFQSSRINCAVVVMLFLLFCIVSLTVPCVVVYLWRFWSFSHCILYSGNQQIQI